MLATGVLPTSPNFGQAKHGQKGPAATFCLKGVVPLCIPVTGLFIFYGPSQYLSSFSSLRPRSKKISFSRISIATCKKNRPEPEPDYRLGIKTTLYSSFADCCKTVLSSLFDFQEIHFSEWIPAMREVQQIVRVRSIKDILNF